MHIERLANELMMAVFASCNSIQDVINLARANHRFYSLFSSSRKLWLLFKVAETEVGPLEEAIQAVTYNNSQPAHHIRTARHSLALLGQLMDLGRSANKWISVYPIKKWRTNFEERRLLSSLEAYRLRRAVYRLTLYARAFHQWRYDRTTRMQRPVILERAQLLHNWSTEELAEVEDFRGILRDMLRSVCPSNGAVAHKFQKRFPDSGHQLLFNVNIHLNYPASMDKAPSFFQDHFHTTHQTTPSARASLAMSKYTATSWHEPGSEGWGDDIRHYYVLEDMLKLEPAQILWLKEHAPLKGMVESYIRSLGSWFENNGETFGQTLEWVMDERGEDIEELKSGIEASSLGIVREA